ncbi:MAG: M23 family metallopeptidase [Lachnospiraceae bacterium]|nr:M23 family metallopeptidase [Lachnospiraceae bacterium]
MDKQIRPYKNRKASIKRERAIMVTSAAAVMAALTLTGVYMKEKNAQEKQDEFSIDLAQMENNVEDRYAKLVDELVPPVEVADKGNTGTEIKVNIPKIEEAPMVDGELDYMPREDSIIDFDVAEVDSGMVEIPGLTDIVEEPIIEEAPQVVPQAFTFTEEEGLIAPIGNEVLMHFNMDNTIYFATLDQYKYNPAVIYKAEVGNQVISCADGIVIDMYHNEELGQVVVLDLGNGYQATYGQLKDVNVVIGSTVTAGQTIANVAEPTIYYSVEGANLYFGLTKDGVAVNPEELM